MSQGDVIFGMIILLGIIMTSFFIREIIRSRALLNNLDWTRVGIWLIPTFLLIVALFKLPYGYYQFLRIAIAIAAIYIIIFEYKLKDKITLWSIVFLLITILFNPLIPIQLDKESWKIINIITALLFVVHLGMNIKSKQLIDDSKIDK